MYYIVIVIDTLINPGSLFISVGSILKILVSDLDVRDIGKKSLVQYSEDSNIILYISIFYLLEAVIQLIILKNIIHKYKIRAILSKVTNPVLFDNRNCMV